MPATVAVNVRHVRVALAINLTSITSSRSPSRPRGHMSPKGSASPGLRVATACIHAHRRRSLPRNRDSTTVSGPKPHFEVSRLHHGQCTLARHKMPDGEVRLRPCVRKHRRPRGAANQRRQPPRLTTTHHGLLTQVVLLGELVPPRLCHEQTRLQQGVRPPPGGISTVPGGALGSSSKPLLWKLGTSNVAT